MERNDLKQKRVKFLERITGNWESDNYLDCENKRCKLKLGFYRNIRLDNYPFVLKAIKEYSVNDKIEVPITFWWLDDILITSSLELKQGVLKLIESESEIGFYYHNLEIVEKNLILKFKKML